MTSQSNELQQQFKVLLDKYLGNRPDAFQWVMSFWRLGHTIDDIIDIPERRADNTFLLATFNAYIDVLSSPFYHRYLARLYPIVKEVHHIYCDSVAWENSDVAWKASFADTYRCSGSALIVAIVEVIVSEETGSYELAFEAGREVSLLAKEAAYHAHHTESGEKV